MPYPTNVTPVELKIIKHMVNHYEEADDILDILMKLDRDVTRFKMISELVNRFLTQKRVRCLKS